MTHPSALLVPLALLAFPVAGDWPQYNGPSSDRTSSEQIGLREWPEDGPPVVWRVHGGPGFSSFTAGGGRVYTLVERELEGAKREVCVALDVADGAELWTAPLGEPEYDRGGDQGTEGNSGGDGPRSTPSHAGVRVYVLDAVLGLYCLDQATGDVVWKRDLVAEFEARPIRWQNAASPLIEGGRVFVAGGGPGQSLLAFDAATGELAWRRGDERMTHATPVAATIHGIRHVIFYVQSGLIAVSPDTGDELWRIPYEYRTSTAASPVVHDDVVYCSAGYSVGAGAFEITKDGDELGVNGLWRKRNRLMNHWSTPVAKDGHLYGLFGFKKYGECPLKCVDIATGEERWSTEGFGPGNCILVGDLLVVLGDEGQLVLVDPTPDGYRELARADVLDGKCWSSPAFADGQLYVRSTSEGVRIDLSTASSSR